MATFDRMSATAQLHQGIAKWLADEVMPTNIIEDINDAGYAGERIIIKADQERPITAVDEVAARNRSGVTVPMAPPQGEAAANTEVDGWIRRAKEQVRVMRLNLEANLKTQIDQSHALWPWLLCWASQLLNRYRIGNDGRTGTQRILGKTCHKEVCGFGEKVFWRPLPHTGHDPPNAEARVYEGVWLGLRRRTDEDIIGTPQGDCSFKKHSEVTQK